jgi:hypothetical protein
VSQKGRKPKPFFISQFSFFIESLNAEAQRPETQKKNRQERSRFDLLCGFATLRLCGFDRREMKNENWEMRKENVLFFLLLLPVPAVCVGNLRPPRPVQNARFLPSLVLPTS